MPPHVPRKRLRASPPPTDKTAIQKSSARGTPAVSGPRRKATLYDDLDATTTPQSNSLLEDLDDDDDESSLTSLSDDEFEDVVPPKPQNNAADSDDDDIEFEDVEAPASAAPDAPVPSGDLELILNRETRISLTNPFGEKKGPSKRERAVRNATHCLHVLTLLWHNAIRNSWVCDQEVQATMISHLPPRMWEEVDRWRFSSGLDKPAHSPAMSKHKGNDKKGKGKAKANSQRESRDWGHAAERLEPGAVDMSHGDPLFRLMQVLGAWWKQRFRVMAPGLRKHGYMSLERLDKLTKAYNADSSDSDRFGERITSVEDFRKCARFCRGSRDVGAQLFTALLRGLGLEARMVANLQTLGFGWNKLEDADPEKDEDDADHQRSDAGMSSAKKEVAQSTAIKGKLVKGETKRGRSKKEQASPSQKANSQAPNTAFRKSTRTTHKDEPIVLDDSDKLDLEYKDTDDESVVEMEVRPKRPSAPQRKFDSDLEYPHYWTEVLSPVTNKYLPVDAIVKNMVGTNRELVESLEPRGSKADKARQMIAYVVAYSPDGTAKDVTVRYLKRQMLPGRTKGTRMPPAKVPVYNRTGKVKRYEMFDWFKTAMAGYRRGGRKTPITDIDEAEESTDLKPAKPEKREVKEGEETLQYYKESKEFILERHLKREEALRTGAKPVKIFKNKAKGGKTTDEDVYLRSDAINVKSAETWHKQGRAPLAGEQPLKRVPYRAATTNRRREIMEAEAATGQKVLQGLYSWDQTDWIIPPPIKDGIIPKNDYGNIDLFAEHMCPRGAVHVPFRGAVKVCKRLQIDYAEAVVDFEFGHRMAVPVISGVVIAEEYHDQVMEELEKDEAERARKEDEKRRKAALGKWRKFLMGMRIIERIRQEYGEIDDSVSVFGHGSTKGLGAGRASPKPADEDMAGGFLPEGYEEEEGEQDDAPSHHAAGFFPTAADEDKDEGDDTLVMEGHEQAKSRVPDVESRPQKNTSATRGNRGSTKRKAATRATRPSTRKRRKVVEEDEEEVEDESAEDSGGQDDPDGQASAYQDSDDER